MSGKNRPSLRATATANNADRRNGLTNEVEGQEDPNAEIKVRVAGIMASRRKPSQGKQLVVQLLGPDALKFV